MKLFNIVVLLLLMPCTVFPRIPKRLTKYVSYVYSLTDNQHNGIINVFPPQPNIDGIIDTPREIVLDNATMQHIHELIRDGMSN